MNQLEIARQASIAPVYETVEFSDFHPARTGSLKVRVNMSRKMFKAVQDAQTSDDPSAHLAVLAGLIPRDTEGDAPITLEEFKQFLAGDDDDDNAFQVWLVDEITRRVGEYIEKHFLARKPLVTS